MHELPAPLRAALAATSTRHPGPALQETTARLVQRYQLGTPARAPLLTSDLDAAAYATYRMPATFAAVRSVFGETARLAPSLAPTSHLDVGGGTGSAVWAAAAVWPSITEHTVLEQAPAVARLGAELAADGGDGVRTTTWTLGDLADPQELPRANLVTASYVLGELDADTRAALVERLLGQLSDPAGVLVVVEPGSVAGHERVLAAREQVLAAGLHLLAPCPHSHTCPMVGTRDWCHFAVRLPRSPEHRRAKGAALGFEDEKLAYLVAVREPAEAAPARVVRHPTMRKGLVQLQLCTREEGLRTEVVSKREGARYRAARALSWGDAWS
ncbi:MAG: small ribosomal subunit Rsm22 family protein [Mycobacteriaceae bacterium]